MHTHSSPSCTHTMPKRLWKQTPRALLLCCLPLLLLYLSPLPYMTLFCFVFACSFLCVCQLQFQVFIVFAQGIKIKNENTNKTKRDETKNEKQRAIRKLRAAHRHTHIRKYTNKLCKYFVIIFCAYFFMSAALTHTHTNVQANTVGQDLHSANNYTRQISVRNCVLIK